MWGTNRSAARSCTKTCGSKASVEQPSFVLLKLLQDLGVLSRLHMEDGCQRYIVATRRAGRGTPTTTIASFVAVVGAGRIFRRMPDGGIDGPHGPTTRLPCVSSTIWTSSAFAPTATFPDGNTVCRDLEPYCSWIYSCTMRSPKSASASAPIYRGVSRRDARIFVRPADGLRPAGLFRARLGKRSGFHSD